MGSTFLPPFYFCLFILAAQFVMLNLVVAVLMKELGDAEKADAEEQAKREAEGETEPGRDDRGDRGGRDGRDGRWWGW